MGTKKKPRALTDNDLVTAREVLDRIPIHRSTLGVMIAEGRFPPPLRLTASKLLWRWSTISRWLDERERDPYPLTTRRSFRWKPSGGGGSRPRASNP